jgi:two-component sensor histidine kinase/Tfp pilus assembly protein PilF
MKPKAFQQNALFIILLLPVLCKTYATGGTETVSDTSQINTILEKARKCCIHTPEKSDSLANLALQQSRILQYAKGEAIASKILATINRISNHNPTAIDYYYSSLSYFKGRDPWQTMEIYQWLGLSLAFEAYYDSGKVFIDKSIELADSLKSTEAKVQSYLNMARLYRIMGKVNEALTSCLTAMQICDSVTDADLVWKVKNFTGFVYLQNNRHKEAAEIFNQNILHYKDHMDMPEEVYRLLFYTADLDLFFKNFARTIHSQKLALKMTDSIPNKNLASYFRAMSYEVLGKVYMQTSKFDSAKYYLSLANNNKEYTLDLHAKANLLYSIGDVFYELHQSDSALYYFSESYRIHQNNKNYTKLRSASLGIGKTYFQMHKYTDAKKYLFKAIENNPDNENTKVLAEAWNLLSSIYESEGDYKNAYRYYKLYKQASDELFSNEKIKNITKLELEYDFMDRQRELENLREKENIAYEAKLKQNRMTLNFAAIGLVLSLIAAALAFSYYRIKKKANLQKETLLREIHHRVKNNLQIISSLLSLQGNYLTDKKVINALNESQGRVKSMALIHQMLYQHDQFSSIDMREYIIHLCNAISSSFHEDRRDIRMVYTIENITIDIDTAVPVGLIINELITNAYKYAFQGKTEGTIRVSLQNPSEKTFYLQISDNGIGMDKYDNRPKKNSFGLNIVQVLIRQLKGEISHINTDGTTYILKFTEATKTTKKK